MFLDIILFIIYTIFCLLSVLGYGIIFKKFIFKPSETNLGETAFFGFLFIFFISLFFHFFINLFYWFNFFILLVGFIVSILDINKIKNQILEVKTYLIIISLIILPSILIFNKHPDYDWYHLPYINYLNNFKIIFGLVNISNNYTYGHGWLDILGLFSLPIVGTKGLSIISFLFYYFFLLYLLIEIKKTKLKSIKIFSIILIIYSLANFNKLVDFQAEIQPTIILFIIILNIIKILDHNNNSELLTKILLYFFLALVLRIGSIIFLPLIIMIIIKNFKEIPKSIYNYFRLAFFLILFFIFFLIKNFILTGCLSYPIYWTCIKNDQIIWSNPIENTKERYEYLSASSKRWKFYTLEEASLKSHFDYYEPMTNGIILDPTSYNKNKFFWLKYWSRDHDIARILNSVLMVIFILCCFSFIAKNRIEAFKLIYIFFRKIKLIHLGFLFTIIMWFFLSPQMRYGGHPAIAGSLIFYSSIIISNYKIEIKKFNFIVLVLLLISSSYFTQKNIIRFAKIINNYEFTNFPWPEYKRMVLGKDYRTTTINNIKLNLILTSENMIKGEPVMCGDVDMLCLPHERIVCVSDIYEKKGYIFVQNKNPKCLIQFKKNYWQH